MSVGDFDDIPITRIALGIRFQNQFGLQDNLGMVVDEILSTPGFGPERFGNTMFDQASRDLVSLDSKETIQLTGSDAIIQLRKQVYSSKDIPEIATEFVDVVWAVVCKHAPRPPSIYRYGCMISFDLPAEWNPIQSVLSSEATDTAEFDLRYVRRMPTESGLASREVNDYRNAIYHIRTRSSKSIALLDFQHVFDPLLNSEKARKDQPFVRFVEKSVAFYRVAGWDFLKSRMERLSRAA